MRVEGTELRQLSEKAGGFLNHEIESYVKCLYRELKEMLDIFLHSI